MKIVIAGGTGFLGRPLCDALLQDGHEVVVLTRAIPPGVVVHEPGSGLPGLTNAGWQPDGGAGIGQWARVVDGVDAVVNLAGDPIAAGRWSPARKARIHDSRILATRSIVGAVRAAGRPPAALVNASAIGFYGDRGDEELSEASGCGTGFLAGVCVDWEAEAQRAGTSATRVAIIRTGIALARDGGALARMLPPFRFFAGGPIGTGRQYMSWIHRADWVDLIRWVLATDTASGVFNAASPAPVTNAAFAKALGRAMGRPAWLPAPAWALRLALGEMAEALLLASQRVVPARAQALGFQFRLATLESALHASLHG